MTTSPGRFATFRRLHDDDRPLVLPNAWDHASAAALFAAGFPAVGTTSLGVAASAGKPDGLGATMRETLDLVRTIAPLGLVTADIEGGFADDPAQVAEVAAQMRDGGAAGINVEDGTAARSLVDAEAMAARVAAIKERVPDLFVNARVDTYWNGVSATVGETVARAARYVDAGADGIFVPGVRQLAEIRALAEQIPRPLNVLFLPGLHTRADLQEAGVRRISTGSLLFRAALHASVTTATAIRDGARDAGAGAPGYEDVQALAADRRT